MIRLIKKITKYILSTQQTKVIKDVDLEYLLWISNLYLKIKYIPGHIAEIGVADGRNTVLFGRLIKIHNDQSDCILEIDKLANNHLDKTRWKNNSRNSVMKRCQDNDVEELVEIFEGDALNLVPKILKDHKGKKFQKGKAKFALLYIDCNTYIPAIKSMENFLPHMMPGGFIVIDEKLQGSETEAILDFARKQNLKVQRFSGNEVPMFIQI